MKFPRSKFGLILATIYTLVAVYVLYDDRVNSGAGFISLKGLTTFLATLPAALLLDKLFPSLNIDSGQLVRDPLTPATALLFAGMVLSCAFLVYLLGALLGSLPKIFKWIFKNSPTKPTKKNLLLLAFTAFLPLLFSRPAFADFKGGYEAFLKKDYLSAATLLSGARPPKSDGITDYYLWALGRSLIEKRDFAEGRKNLAELLKAEPNSLLANGARVQLGRALQGEGQSAKAKEYLNPLLPTLESELKGEALFYLALAEAAGGEKETALGHLKQAYFEFPSASVLDQVPTQWQKISGGAFPTGSPEERMGQANRWFEAKNYSKALDLYAGLSDDPDPARRELARVKRGESLYALKRYSDAELYLTPGATIDAATARAALLHRGMSQLRSSNEAGAIATFEELQSRYPGTPEGEEALYRAGMIVFQAGRLSEASVVFQRLTQSYPQGNFRDKGIWAAAWAAYRRSDFPAALNWLKSLETGATDAATRGKALYWQARIAEQQGQADAAKKTYELASKLSPYSYYGFMALKKLHNSEVIPQTPAVPAEWKLTAAAPNGAGVKHAPGAAGWETHFKKAESLARIGVGRLAQPELEAALKQAEKDPSAMAQLLEAGRKTQEYFIPVLLSQKYWDRFKPLFANPETAEIFRTLLQYPFAYRHEVEKSAARSGVPAALVLGLMRQESGFMPWITSGAKAQGLMQLLPATAGARARSLGMAEGDLFDPDYNIMIGAAELKAMLDRFSDHWPQAMAAYNAGPGNARKWAEQFGSLATDEWVEEVPFAETNLYIKLVLRNYWNYQSLFPK